ncbi:hypothetical protein EAH79_01615 [Sphingomonas koreensis]|nr:hypothetical protein EAH79_01615 [Sphingomonas koreensis]
MTILAFFLAGLFIANPASAASKLDGTWKADIKATKFDERPEFLLLKDGIYECLACTPPIRLPADGKPHPTPDRDYADAMSVTVVDDRTMRVASLKADKMYAEYTRTLSDDGNIMTTVMRSSNNATGEWKTSTSQLRRVGPAPAGAYAQSGYWSPVVTEATKPAGDGIVITLRVRESSLELRDNEGATYIAPFSGSSVPVIGDASGGTVAIRSLSPVSFEETNYIKGKVTAINTYILTDPMTLTISSRNVRSGYTDTYVLRRQPRR